MNTDRNLLFGVIAVQMRLISAEQFSEVAKEWTALHEAGKNTSLRDLLIARNYLTPEQCQAIEAELNLQLKDYNGDVVLALSDLADADSLQVLEAANPARFSQTVVTGATPRDGLRGWIVSVDPFEHEDVPSNPSAGSSEAQNLDRSQSRYTLSRITGEGGLGRVWLGRDLDLNRKVAIKEIRPEHAQNRDAVSRFMREAQVTGQLEHPNIVPVYELARSPVDQRPYYSMKFVRGRTLKTVIREYHERRRNGAVDPVGFRDLLTAFVAICRAIGYAHTRSVLHRDLKPDNVMVGRFGEVILLDWGLARVESDREASIEISQVEVTEKGHVEATQAGKVLGTPAYMSPEQASGRLDLVDSRTDIYGLGAILFEILIGKPPHGGRLLVEVLKSIVAGPPPEARLKDPTVPAALNAICLKAMAQDRANRYPKAVELADDVMHWLADEPVSAYAEPIVDRAFRWLRKHRAWTVSGSVAMTLTAVVAIVAALFIDRARQREAAARHEAVERLADAERAIDVSLTGVSEVLKYYPSAQPVRQRLFSNAAEDYERLANVHSDDLDLQLEAARARLRLGNARLAIDQFEAAIREFDAAATRFAALESQLPLAAFERGLCLSRKAFALSRSGQNKPARDTYLQAMQLFDASAAKLPPTSTRRTDFAGACVDFAVLLHGQGDLNLARERLAGALQQLEVLAAGTPESATVDRSVRHTAAVARHAQAQIELAAGQFAPAAVALQGALDEYLALLREEPNHPAWLDGRALARITLANLHRRTGRDLLALENYQAAVTDFDDLARAIPGVPHYERACVIARTDCALLLQALGQGRAAQEVIEPGVARLVRLTEESQNSIELIELAATAHAAYGGILGDLGETDNALTALGIAVEILHGIPNEMRSIAHRRQLAVAELLAARLAANRALQERQETFARAELGLQSLLAENVADDLSRQSLAWGHLRWGEVLLVEGNQAQAHAQFRRAAELWRETPEQIESRLGHLWLLLTCSDAEIRDAAQAVELAARLIANAKDNPRLAALLALAHAMNGNLDDAERLARQSQRIQPDANSTAQVALALVAHARKESQQAATHFEAAKAIVRDQHPGNPEALRLLRLIGERLEISAELD